MFINKDLYQKTNAELSVGEDCLIEYEPFSLSFFSSSKESVLFRGNVKEIFTITDYKLLRKFLSKNGKSSYDLDDCKNLAKDISQIAVIKKLDVNEDNMWIVGRNKKTGFWYGNINSGSLSTKKIVHKISIDQVCIADEKKKNILDTLSQIKNSHLIFDTWGFAETIEKGRAISMLFYGKPGTGKTLMAQAISDFLDFDLLTITPTDLNDKYFGETEKKIREVFKKSDSRSVILFDECDGLIMDRKRGADYMVAHINQFIYDLEHFDGVCIFTTNNIDFLDKALERRLALKVEFEEPDEKTRANIWRKIIPEKCPLHKDVDFEYLSKFPINGGHIKNIVLNAARSAAHEQSKNIKMSHFIEAINSENKGIKGFNNIK